MWELDHKDSLSLKNWCFWTVVLEKTIESPLDWQDTKPVNPKTNQSWSFIWRTDTEAEASLLWQPDVKHGFTVKGLDAGKDRRQEQKGMTNDDMVGLHHRLSRHEFEQATGVDDGRGSLGCCSPWGHRESDTTRDWAELKVYMVVGEGKNVWKHLSWIESPKKAVLHIWPSVIQNGTLFGNRVLTS